MTPLDQLQAKIVRCRQCPRLVKYLKGIRDKYPTYWNAPVPSFGDANAEILLVGLAPGRFGSNRTGRMFTGDTSGDFLYPTLFETGLASKPKATDRKDGLTLKNTYITAAVRCAPPQNKPDRSEFEKCRPYLAEEVALLPKLKVVIALGKIGHDEYLKVRLKQEGGKLSQFPFGHGAIHHLKEEPKILIDTYHPSRQNTNTGKLTKKMFLKIFERATRELQ